MAEYITKEQVLKSRCENCPVNCCTIHCNSYKAIENLPSEDVVERSIINKIIKDIENLEPNEYQKTYYHALMDVLNVFESYDIYLDTNFIKGV